MNYTPCEIIADHEQFDKKYQALVREGTALQADEFLRQHNAKPHPVEWMVEVTNVGTTSFDDNGDRWCLIDGVVTERGRWGFGSKRWTITARMVVNGQRERMLALNRGQLVRLSGNASYRDYYMNKSSFYIYECILLE